MLLPLLFLVGFADWVPARWHSGDPKTLDLLQGAAVNCVLLEPQHWNAAFVKTAAERHIATLGIVHSTADAERAKQLKLNGIVTEGDDGGSIQADGMTVIRLPSRGRMPLDSGDPIIGTIQALWPGIEIAHGGTVSTGPTSVVRQKSCNGGAAVVHPRLEGARDAGADDEDRSRQTVKCRWETD